MSSRNPFACARCRGIPEHGAGDAERILFFDAPHRHAQVCGLHDDRHAKRIDLFANRFSDLARQALLNLKPAAEDVDQPRSLAETNDFVSRDVCDVTFAEKRQDMVLAQAVEIDVLDDAISLHLDREQSAVEDLVDIRVALS